MFGLIAATGLRVSEAIALRLDDVRPDGVLHIRETKFCKSRLVPLHQTVVEALARYLERRRRIAADSDCLFPSVRGRALCPSTVELHLPLSPAAGGRRAWSKTPAADPRSSPYLRDAGAGAMRRRARRDRPSLRRALNLSRSRRHPEHLLVSAGHAEMMTDIAAAAEMLVGSEAA